jgi:hypothetical protein
MPSERGLCRQLVDVYNGMQPGLDGDDSAEWWRRGVSCSNAVR